MLRDETIAEGETWTVVSYDAIWFDLNGHTFDIQGTFTGGYTGTQYSNGQYYEVTYPTQLMIVSTIPGTFRSSGILDVSIQPWTSDTYYFTGGESRWFMGADGGTFYISGGVFFGNVFFNNGNDESDLTVFLSGDASFAKIEYAVYSDADLSYICMTVEDDVSITELDYTLMGEGNGNKPNLILNGGYYGADPRSLLTGYVPVPAAEVDHGNMSQYYVNRYGTYVAYDDLTDAEKQSLTDYYILSDTALAEYVEFATEPEEYSGQTDWAADSALCTWRIQSHVHDWNEPEYEWSENYATVTARRTCKLNPSHVESETSTTTSSVTTPATQTETGVRTYTATFTNPAFSAVTKTKEIPVLGSYIPGDIDADEGVDMDDVLSLLRYIVLPDIYDVSAYGGSLDFNNDGQVNIYDVIRLLQYFLFPDLYPIE
jgi:hypothetical protein